MPEDSIEMSRAGGTHALREVALYLLVAMALDLLNDSALSCQPNTCQLPPQRL